MVITLVNIGLRPDFQSRWMSAFALAFPVAFPSIVLVLPVARKMVARLVDQNA